MSATFGVLIDRPCLQQCWHSKLNWTDLRNQSFFQELFTQKLLRNIKNWNWAVISDFPNFVFSWVYLEILPNRLIHQQHMLGSHLYSFEIFENYHLYYEYKCIFQIEAFHVIWKLGNLKSLQWKNNWELPTFTPNGIPNIHYCVIELNLLSWKKGNEKIDWSGTWCIGYFTISDSLIANSDSTTKQRIFNILCFLRMKHYSCEIPECFVQWRFFIQDIYSNLPDNFIFPVHGIIIQIRSNCFDHGN